MFDDSSSSSSSSSLFLFFLFFLITSHRPNPKKILTSAKKLLILKSRALSLHNSGPCKHQKGSTHRRRSTRLEAPRNLPASHVALSLVSLSTGAQEPQLTSPVPSLFSHLFPSPQVGPPGMFPSFNMIKDPRVGGETPGRGLT